MSAVPKTIQANTTAEIRRSKKRKLWEFHGGVHPKFNKEMSNQAPIKVAAIPSQLVVPLQQSMGAGAEPIVDVEQVVFKGQVIAIALVVAAGVATYVLSVAAADSLKKSQHHFYREVQCIALIKIYRYLHF